LNFAFKLYIVCFFGLAISKFSAFSIGQKFTSCLNLFSSVFSSSGLYMKVTSVGLVKRPVGTYKSVFTSTRPNRIGDRLWRPTIGADCAMLYQISVSVTLNPEGEACHSCSHKVNICRKKKKITSVGTRFITLQNGFNYL
jgi:hypothetical protein